MVAIIQHNYAVIDAVFGNDVPLCAVNLKKLYCEVACSPNKANFVNGTGMVKQPGTGRDLTAVTYSVDEDVACTLFQSCKKVSLIA